MLRVFAQTRNSDAFAALMRRHGPMVYGLARRIVGDHQLAEDVFQAAFLILARRASALTGRESLPAWLHSVAFRLAIRAKKKRRCALEIEALAASPSSSDLLEEISAREYLTILDSELNRLPEKYRLPLILCQLEGLTQEAAAGRLGVSAGVLKGRLERGRVLLRDRLAKRGLEAGLCGLLPLAASVSPALVQSTLHFAVTGQGATLTSAALVKGAMKMMLLARIRTICLAALLVGAAGWGAGWAALEARSAKSETSAKETQAAKRKLLSIGQAKDRRVDLYGDPLPEGAVMRLGTVQRRANGASLVLTADGKVLIGLRGGKQLSFWDAETGKLKETRELEAAQQAAPGFGGGVSSNGKWIINWVANSLRLFDIQTGKLVYDFATKGYKGGGPWLPVFSNDGRYVATAWASEDHFQLKAWDLETGKEAFSQVVATDNAKRSSVNPSNSAGQRYDRVFALFFSPDGQKLVASLSSLKLPAICWDFSSGKQLWQVAKGPPEGKDFAFTAKGQLLWPGGAMDLATGASSKPDKLLPRPMYSKAASTPDGRKLLISNTEGVLVWDLKNGKEERLLKGAGDGMVVARDGKTLITNNGGLQRWDLETGKALYPDDFNEGHIQDVTALVFSADGKRLASAAADGSVRLWDVDTARVIYVWRAHEAYRPFNVTRWVLAGVQALDVAPDGHFVVSAGSEGRIKTWDGFTGNEVWNLALPNLAVGQQEDPIIVHLRLSQDSKNVMGLYSKRGSSSEGGEWQAYWDLQKGKLQSKKRPPIPLGQSSLSRDGRIWVQSGTVVDIATGVKRHYFPGETKGDLQPSGYMSVLSADGSLVADDFFRVVNVNKRQDGTITGRGVEADGGRLWETFTGQLIAHFKGKPWRQVAFHPQSHVLAVVDTPNVQIWDLLSGELVKSFKMPTGSSPRNPYICTRPIAFAPDGRLLATGEQDGNILLWNLDLPLPKSAQLKREEVESLWADLKDPDAAKAWKAVWRMVDAPDSVLPYLGGKLKPSPSAPAETTAPLLSDLASDVYAKREAANKRLKDLGFLAERALRDKVKENPPLEVRQRIEALLKSLLETPPALTPDSLRELRAVAVLARIPSPEARRILEDLTRGADSAPLTLAAKTSLAAQSK